MFILLNSFFARETYLNLSEECLTHFLGKNKFQALFKLRLKVIIIKINSALYLFILFSWLQFNFTIS
jgi:hypothetical protein